MPRRNLKNISRRKLSALLHQSAVILGLAALIWCFLHENDVLTVVYRVLVVYLLASIMAYILEIALIRAQIWSEKAVEEPQTVEEPVDSDEEEIPLETDTDSEATQT